MIVSNRMVKPHMVKKWARPGTVHCSSLRWPATSTVSASTLRLMGPRERLGSFFPERMSLDSQWKRRAAMPNPMTVTRRPMMILTGTNAPRLSQIVKQEMVAECERHLGLRCGPEDSGVTTSGRSRGFRGRLPWFRRRPSDARLEGGENSQVRVPLSCNTAQNSWVHLAVFGHGVIAFTQRVEFPRSRGRSSEAEHQLPKLRTRVRSSSPALANVAGGYKTDGDA